MHSVKHSRESVLPVPGLPDYMLLPPIQQQSVLLKLRGCFRTSHTCARCEMARPCRPPFRAGIQPCTSSHFQSRRPNVLGLLLAEFYNRAGCIFSPETLRGAGSAHICTLTLQVSLRGGRSCAGRGSVLCCAR